MSSIFLGLGLSSGLGFAASWLVNRNAEAKRHPRGPFKQAVLKFLRQRNLKWRRRIADRGREAAVSAHGAVFFRRAFLKFATLRPIPTYNSAVRIRKFSSGLLEVLETPWCLGSRFWRFWGLGVEGYRAAANCSGVSSSCRTMMSS